MLLGAIAFVCLIVGHIPNASRFYREARCAASRLLLNLRSGLSRRQSLAWPESCGRSSASASDRAGRARPCSTTFVRKRHIESARMSAVVSYLFVSTDVPSTVSTARKGSSTALPIAPGLKLSASIAADETPRRARKSLCRSKPLVRANRGAGLPHARGPSRRYRLRRSARAPATATCALSLASTSPLRTQQHSGQECPGAVLHARRERRSERLGLLGCRASVQVATGRRERAVTHRLLDGHDIHAARRQERSERMP